VLAQPTQPAVLAQFAQNPLLGDVHICWKGLRCSCIGTQHKNGQLQGQHFSFFCLVTAAAANLLWRPGCMHCDHTDELHVRILNI
jgi:hypothetical protein